MDDLIKREDATETFAELYDVFDDYPNIVKELHKTYDKILAIPSAEKHGEWIPCSERLPDTTGFYLCTVNRDTPNVKTMKFELLVGDEYRWLLMNGTEAFPRFIIAWMPLPKPWEGANNE
jgi:hypothetical protein